MAVTLDHEQALGGVEAEVGGAHVVRADVAVLDADGVVEDLRPARDPEKARRLFIFKQVNGKARALWMGSKLGGILEDFRFVDGKIRALESTTDSLFVVSDYKWDKFGMAFDQFIIKGVDQETAIKTFSQ